MKNYPCNYEGQRIRKEVVDSSKETPVTKVNNYYYNGEEILYITDTNDKKITENILDTDFTLRFYNNQPTLYTLNTDGRGSTSVVVDSLNRGITGYKYDEFGSTEIVGNTEFNNEVCYTGQVYDKETGDYYYNARYYSPDDGRFVTVDTYRGEFEEPLSLHLYAYCKNDPINYNDYSGHKYDRGKAMNYASKMWNKGYYDYIKTGYYYYKTGDCANFVSQCLYKGGIKTDKDWYSKRSVKKKTSPYAKRDWRKKYDWKIASSWRQVNPQRDYLKKGKVTCKGEIKKNTNMKEFIKKYKPQKGDILNFRRTPKKSINHAAMINNVVNNTKKKKYGIKYTGHTDPAWNKNVMKYFDDYPDGSVYVLHVK
ncbi:amidase domain-containing protein [Anaerofustis stercorihominis]|uniref:amidase domain-containing protein n=1 Tax=Anaerofustis stercorihominis TaxID=214853 RepID=UPI00214C440A|nr:amidase domain-containing protein [Anaerofustis stercorihominis]MCR2033422.1 amidase domain-containing protein [Anaerofustis stercorihominis]